MRWVLTLPVCPHHITAQGHNERCNITVADAGHVSAVGDFSTENGYDYLTIDGQRYGGRTGPSEVLLQPGAVITWYSDGSVGRAGWTVCLTPMTTRSPTVPGQIPPTAAPAVTRLLTVTGGNGQEGFCRPTTVEGNPHCVRWGGSSRLDRGLDFSCTMQVHAAGYVSAVGVFDVRGVNDGCG